MNEILRIKEIAKEKGISMEEIANQLGINRVTLSRNINGNPTLSTIQKIAEVLDVDVKDLLISTKQKKEKDLLISDDDGQLKVIGKIDLNEIID